MKTKTTARRAAAWLALLALLGGAAALRLLSAGKEGKAEAAMVAPVRVVQASFGPLVKELKVNAFVESDSMVTVLPLVSGILQTLEVEAGDRVRKGQVLARIDAARYELQLGQAEAAWLSAKSTFERVEQLFRAGATSSQNYDQAKGQYDAYRAQYDLAKLQAGYAAVTSPVDGVVLVRHTTVGSIAAPERPLVTIGDLSRLVIRARVPERYYAEFRGTGAPVAVRVERSDGGSFPARLSSVSPYISAENRTFEATCDLGPGQDVLRPGMSVVAVFVIERRDGVWSLPFEVLVGGDTAWYVEEDGAGQAVARKLALPPGFSSEARFEIPEGEAGKTFIVEGQHFIRDGAPVRVAAGAP
ncbi:MAG TPA: efflux RND transporter periplasmic adaptor subunit [Spirochaetales bacterium]|nr:efflux RND transporter periplasmic adaptor subunit [Spirochaetales bacterium]